MKTPTLLFLLGAIAILGASCSNEETGTASEKLVLPEVPYTYSGNSDVATLGRVLFYDRQLSLNNSVSCSSCHKQALAFADNVAFSTGFAGKVTARNSMPIQNIDHNIIFEGSFTALFWDGRESNLQTMTMRPLVNHIEMGVTDFDALEKKLAAVSYYPDLFQKAYGSAEVTREGMSSALAEFLRNITSTNTRLDLMQQGQIQFTALEEEGKMLFTEKYDCNACHQVQDPSGYVFAGTFANIGLDEDYTDNGVGKNTKVDADNGKFKIPSLRNVMLTAPYMHDGRFQTLEDVMEHYSENIQDHPNLDARLRNASGAPMKFHITASEKKAIIAFLNTLTDTQMITDPRFSNPFKVQ